MTHRYGKYNQPVPFTQYEGSRITVEDVKIIVDTLNNLTERLDEIDRERFAEDALRKEKPVVQKAWDQYQFVRTLSKDHT